ncbi:unnamed protein product [Adineta ricciae]|uniref:Ig-like domain-containing protein n=1 Tax=Adineta ricciae TaxID=249248 RepID=A0A815X2V6_ADIRI|nr:unnamed protein product [Adineta ricciae]CAF1657416.1 unnamed protein product [Adineta ricciae]
MLVLLIVLFLASVHLAHTSRAVLKLTFDPDEAYYPQGSMIEIRCEMLNADDTDESPQLWYVDSKTGKSAHITRTLLNKPVENSPDIFKRNQNGRFEYVKRNHLRIRHVILDDTSRYECSCPDCEETLEKHVKELHVMKLAEPKWQIEPDWPMQEYVNSRIKCTVDDFYPYIKHKVLRNHYDITDEGYSLLLNSKAYPQKFSWKATVIPTADWHNSTIHCAVTIGDSEHWAVKTLQVLFAPRFDICLEEQVINKTQQNASIACTYAGNPKPEFIWFRKTDGTPLAGHTGITINTMDDYRGRYTDVVTFDRDVLATDYEQLLDDGFVVELKHLGEVQETRTISIIDNFYSTNAPKSCGSSTNTTRDLLYLTILVSFIMIQHINSVISFY